MDSERFQHKKSLGQHFLNSEVVPRWMCDAGDVEKGDTVLEIGPGTGALTRELIKCGAQVVAVEADPRAIAALEATFAGEIAARQLRLLRGDMRTLTVPEIAQAFGLTDHSYKLIANIPYYLSGLLFRTFLETPVQPSTVVFLVQKEVALRICRDKKESLLSLSVKLFGTPSYIRTVGKGHFTPPPLVDSAIVRIADISHSSLTAEDTALFFKLLHLGFGQKRKQLLGNLSLHYKRKVLESIFTDLGISRTTRAEDIELSHWISLVHSLSTVQ